MEEMENGGTSTKENGHVQKTMRSVSIAEPEIISQISSQPPYVYEQTKFDKIRQKYFKHMPQIGAIFGALLLVVYNGQLFCWAIFNPQMQKLDYDKIFPYDKRTVHFYAYLWFWGTVAGSFLCVGMAVIEKTRTIYGICLGATLAGVFYLVLLPVVYEIIAINRVIAAMAFGICYTHLIKHAANIAVPQYRGTIVSLIHFSLILGAFINAINFIPFIDARVAEEIIGTEFFGIIYTAVGVVFAVLFTTESPLRLIIKNQENKALEAMSDLRTGTPEEDEEVIAAFHELKEMLQEENEEKWWQIFSKGNLFPLFFVALLKLSFFLSFNFLINEVLADDLYLQTETNDFSSLLLLGVRLFGVCFVLLTIDKKRRWHIIGIVGAAISAIILCGLTFAPYDQIHAAIFVFCVIFEFSCGIGIGALGDVYASEVFSTTKRPFSISIIVGIEFLLQYIAYEIGTRIELTLDVKSAVYGITGILLAFIASFSYFFAPETARLSLRNSRDTSRKFTPRYK